MHFVFGILIYFIRICKFDTGASVSDTAHKYELMVTPSDWTFAIWAVIYLWQFAWIIYVLYLCYRYEMKQIIIGRLFYIFFILANVLNALWIITWCHQYIICSGIILVSLTICLCTSVTVASYYIMVKAAPAWRCYDYSDEIPCWLNRRKQFILIFLLLDGVACYAQWTLIASCLNIGVILRFKGGLTNETASLITLGLLTFLMITYWYFDFHQKFKKISRFVYTPYAVLSVAFCGIITKHGLDLNQLHLTSIVSLALFVVACMVFLLKLYVSLFASNTRFESQWNNAFLSESD